MTRDAIAWSGASTLAYREHEPDRDLDELARIVVEAGLKVHKSLGPGLLESVYEHCLAHELQARAVPVQRQPDPPLASEGDARGYGCRLNLVVADAVVVEIGAVDAPARLQEPEVLAQLRASGYRLGLLLNFSAEPFGAKRFVI